MKNFFLFSLSIAFIAFASCKQTAGEEAEVNDAAEVAASVGKEIPVDAAASVINWEGSKPTGTHTGTINLAQGTVAVDGGKVTGGSFVIDMNTITDTDLDGNMKNNLENHLKGFAEGKEDHFFNVAQYPTASFEITKVTSLEGDAAANHMVYGNLTMKGVTKEVGFKANVSVTDNQVVVTTPQFTIDRTQWGVNYNSKSVFDNLGDNFINDEIGLRINLTAGQPAI